MKLSKIKRNVLFLLVIFLAFNFAKADGEWCWTVSMANDPTWVFNKEAGNVNWGYCKSEEDSERIVNYEIHLKASTLPGSIAANQISIEVYGSLGALDTKVISLGSSVIKKEKFKDKDIGVLNKLTVYINEGVYRCEDIVVSKGPTKYIFRCVKKLGPCNSLTGFNAACMADLIPDGDTEYTVTIKTGDSIDSMTTSPVLIGLVGKKGTTDYMIFSDKGLKNGSKVSKTFFFNDVGDITGFNLQLDEEATWKPEFILISQPTSNQMRQWSLTNASFGPGNLIYRFDTNAGKVSVPGASSTSFILNNGNFNPKLKDMYKQVVADVSKQMLDLGSNGRTMDFGGFSDPNSSDEGMMEPEELENIIELTCEQEMVNPSPDQIIFGDNFPTSNINYMNLIAKCPGNCHRYYGNVIGMGIHPENTPICLAAMLDNAISDYGGIISLSIYPGLKHYGRASNVEKSTKKNITVNSSVSKVKKSFVVAKVDNPDLVEKDIRILDNNGKLSHEGRIEVRVNGSWRTICNRRLDLSSARMICRELGYSDGKWEEDVSCNGFNGENYCGSENYSAIFSDLSCQDVHKKFSECNKKLASESECGRDYDAIILCTNINYDATKSIPNGTVKLENTENEDYGIIGRVEYFMKDWGTICNLGSTDKTAQLVCKKMGYKYGSLQDYPRFRRTKTDSTKINAILECQNSHTSLGNCKVKVKDINCDHSQDLIVKCWGGEGDHSGRSQYPKEPAVGPPQLGKLGLSTVTAKCNTFGNNVAFRGDPGSIYYVTCPADCHKLFGIVWGTGIYTNDSNLCLAAIHSGVIKSNGGTFVYIKTWGQTNYKGSYAFGVNSNNLNRSDAISFTLSVPNPGWRSMMNYAKIGSGTMYLEKYSTVGLSESSHLFTKILQKKNPYLYSSFLQGIFSNAARNLGGALGAKAGSMIGGEIGAKIGASVGSSLGQGLGSKVESKIESKLSNLFPQPVWEWLEPDAKHKFSNTGAILINDKLLPPMESYTIVMQIKMLEFKGRTFLFSCDENQGFNVFLNEKDNLFVGAMTGKDAVDTQLQIPLNQMVVIMITQHHEKFNIRILGSGIQTKEIKKKKAIKTCSKLAIGRHATNAQDYFYGLINFIQIFNQELDAMMIPAIIDAALKKPRSAVKINKHTTVDNRSCISACTNAPIPGSPGAPNMPAEADPFPADNNIINQDSSSMSCGYNNKVDSIDIVGVDRAQADQINILMEQNAAQKKQDTININISNTINIVQQTSRPPIESTSPAVMQGLPAQTSIPHPSTSQIKYISCELTLREKQFDGNVGEKFRVKCDEDCSQRNDINVFGSYIYSPDSSVCKAAYHSGVLEKGSTGYIVVQLVEGKKIYNQSLGADGSMSITTGAEQRSFITRVATPPIKVTCQEAANSNQFAFANTGKIFLVLCPSKCTKARFTPIYGEEVYADMSPICPAAEHWGVVGDKGGEVEFMIEGSQSTYKGTKGFGVTSVARGQYIRSFRILGTRATIYLNYKEDFQGKFTEKYKVFPDPTLYKVPTEGWTFKKIKSLIHGVEKQIWVITNKTRITSNSNYGTIIFLQNSEFVNGRIRTSWMFNKLLTHAMLFRYVDYNNYYAVEFNLENKIGPNIRLLKRVESSLKTVGSVRRKLFTSKWYKITILLDYDQVTVQLQSDNLRFNEVIFDAKMNDIYRGKIGYASNGSTDFNISAIEIDNNKLSRTIKDPTKNRRHFNKILQQTSETDRKAYCTKEFMPNDPNLKYCSMPRVYCKMRCDSVVSTLENISNYNCLKDCMKVLLEEEKRKKNAPSPVLKPIVEEEEDMSGPKTGLKVDFLPPYGKSKQDYTPGVVEKVFKLGGKFYVDISYDSGSDVPSISSNLEYPGDKIKKCKSQLLNRTDCNDTDKSGKF